MQSQGDFEAALTKIAEATKLAPDDSELQALGESIQVQKAAEQEQQRVQNQVSDLLRKAQVALNMGNLDEASQQVQTALELDADNQDTLALKQNVDQALQAAAERERVARESETLAAEA